MQNTTENGSYTFTARDGAGNATSKTVTVNKIDKKEPTIEYTEPGFSNKEVTINVTVKDNESGLLKGDISVDDGIEWDKLSPDEGKTIRGSFTVTENGSYTITAKDKAGNEKTETINVNKIDKKPPTIDIKEEITSDKSKVLVLVKYEDFESGVDLSSRKILRNADPEINDKEFLEALFDRGYGESLTDDFLEIDQNETFAIYVKDYAGNVTIEVRTISGLDKTPPEIKVTSITPNENSTNATIQVYITDNNSTIVSKKWELGKKDKAYFRIKENGKNIIDNSFTVEDNGIYSIYAKDAAGNEKLIDDVKVDLIDKTPPTIKLEAEYVPNSNNKKVKITATFGEVTFDNRWAEDTANPKFTQLKLYGTKASFTVENNGTYIVCAKDQANNETCEKITITLIDNVGPIITHWKQNGYSNKENGFKITTYITDINGVTVQGWAKGKREVSFFKAENEDRENDEKNLAEGKWKQIENNEFTVYENGTYTIFAEDELENRSVEWVVVSEILDGAPEITLSEQTSYSNTEVTITADIEANDSGIALQKFASGVQKPLFFRSNGTTFTGTTFKVDKNGLYTVYVKDGAGNEQVETILVTKVDKKKPEITIDEINVFSKVSIPVNVNIVDPSETINNENNETVDAGASGVALTKWAKGEYDVDYFEKGGTMFTGNSFEVTENGVYTVYAIDKAGNATVETVEVENIDKALPELTLELDKQTGKITITAKDTFSGIGKIILPSGHTVEFEDDNEGNYVKQEEYIIEDNGKYTFAAVDRAGNKIEKIIEIKDVDLKGPVIVAKEHDRYSKDASVIHLTIHDQSAIKTVKWLEGKKSVEDFENSDNESNEIAKDLTNSVTLSFTVNKNGLYTIYAEDTFGKKTVQTINVQNIDNVPPVIEPPIVSFVGEDRVIFINVTDDNSGVERVVLPDGSTTTETTFTYNVTKNPTGDNEYTFVAYDNAGNKSSVQKVKVEPLNVSIEELETLINETEVMDPDFISTITRIQYNMNRLKDDEKNKLLYYSLKRYNELLEFKNKFDLFREEINRLEKELNYKNHSIRTDSNVYKEWTITFSTKPLNSKENIESIIVYDKFGRIVDTTVTIQGNKITVKPKTAYVKNNTYYLVIHPTLVDENKQKLVNGVIARFIIN